jgi:alkylation response protein AidB-like acyl-CoA dehydrogenase
MDFALNDEQREWQARARRFADEEIRRISAARDAVRQPRETWDWEIIEKGSRLGFRTAAVPQAWGGHGIGFVTQALVMAELAQADSAISKAFSQNWKWSHLIAEFCTDDQKRRFLSPFLADHRYVIGSASTEPNSGSDNRYPPLDDLKAGFRLRADRDGDHWLLNGEKCFIANGSVGKLFFVSARTDFSVVAREGTTIFMVPADTPGFRVGKIFNKSGWRFYQNAELIFDNARVPHANVVGEVNGGARIRSGSASEFGDLELAANALGVCEAACDSALAHARTRTQGGKPLLEQQAVQLSIGRMRTLTEALRAYVLRTAWEMDQGGYSSVNAVLVMNFSTDVIQEVTERNMAIHGAAGYTMNAEAAKLVRDAIIWTHLAGDASQRLKVIRRFPKNSTGPGRN